MHTKIGSVVLEFVEVHKVELVVILMVEVSSLMVEILMQLLVIMDQELVVAGMLVIFQE